METPWSLPTPSPPDAGRVVAPAQQFRVREAAFTGGEPPDPGFPALPLGVEQRVLRKAVHDQLFANLQEATAPSKAPPDAARHAQIVSVLERQNRRNAVDLKADRGKSMHRLNIQLQKSYKDMVKAIRDLSKASNVSKGGPEYLMASMHRMLIATRSYISVLRPMVPLMQDMNQANQQLVRSAGVERAALGTALGQKGFGLTDPETTVSLEDALGDTTNQLRMDLQEGKFFFNWTRESLADGLALVNEAVDTLKLALKNGREFLPPDMAKATEARIERLEGRYDTLKQGCARERIDKSNGI
ncbi:MAG: hypothetical protein AB1758_23505, partial [Candidatus Eremiobacterota bacterium]